MGSCGSKGDDQIRAQDEEVRQSAFEQLQDMKEDYDRMSGADGYFANKIRQLEEDTNIKQSQAKDQFDLVKSQQNKIFNASATQGKVTYNQQLADTRNNIAKLIEKSNIDAVATRDSGSENFFAITEAEGKSGMASAGKRARKSLLKKKSQGVDTIALGLIHAKESSEQNIRNAEISMNKERSNNALSMQNATDSAELTMATTRKNLEREMVNNTAEIEEAREKALSNITQQAKGIKASTVSSFKDQHSSWKRNIGESYGTWFFGIGSGKKTVNAADATGNDWDYVPSDIAWDDKFGGGE
jgi:uncharacterized protein YbjQ (UPF0145 family)